ncbi:hypothetical protein [Sphaerisporangium aureirubrum]|uniref:Uncharacterized protein n=1 Tax=Sphaerisporangium aureirubrum TaxID=1544736 RepID=A0ABW1NLU9_9ACTN
MAEQTFTAEIPMEKQVPTVKVKDWAFQARTDLASYIKTLTIRDDVKPYAEALEKHLLRLEKSITDGTDEAVARATFIETVTNTDYGNAWAFYIDRKTAADLAFHAAAAKVALQQLVNSARDAAVRVSKQNSGGPGSAVGTVIAGLADASTGTTYTGTSGNYAYVTQHPLMAQVLAGTAQAEKWPVTGCAEVDAMNTYLLTTNFTKLSDIPRGKLHFHAETYNWSKGTWQARGACSNCDQWLKKIGAGRI